MLRIKRFLILVLFFLILFGISNVVNAADISYKTEFFTSINTAIYVNGLDNNLESGYNYYIYVTQDNTINIDEIISKAKMAKYDSLQYDLNNQQYYLKTSQYSGIFEKSGDYYAYIVKGDISKTGLAGTEDSFSFIDGPTKLERPASLLNGNRITMSFTNDGATYYIKQYDYYTKMYGTNRKIYFYLGKLEDTNILTKLSNKDSDAYDMLYSYAKNNSNYVFSGNFDTTSTGVLNYNIWKDYSNFKNGEYYFVYYKLDDENEIYINVDDVQAYTVNSLGILDNFSKYTFIPENEEKTKNKEEVEDSISESTEQQLSNQKEETLAQENKGTSNNDKTIVSRELPNTGQKVRIYLIPICTILIGGILAYFKYRKIKDI